MVWDQPSGFLMKKKENAVGCSGLKCTHAQHNQRAIQHRFNPVLFAKSDQLIIFRSGIKDDPSGFELYDVVKIILLQVGPDIKQYGINICYIRHSGCDWQVFNKTLPDADRYYRVISFQQASDGLVGKSFGIGAGAQDNDLFHFTSSDVPGNQPGCTMAFLYNI